MKARQGRQADADRKNGPSGKNLLLVVRRQRFDEIDEFAADPRVGDFHESTVELQALGAVEEVDDVARRAVLREAARLRLVMAWRILEKEGGMSPEEAVAWMASFKEAKRYRRDVY